MNMYQKENMLKMRESKVKSRTKLWIMFQPLIICLVMSFIFSNFFTFRVHASTGTIKPTGSPGPWYDLGSELTDGEQNSTDISGQNFEIFYAQSALSDVRSDNIALYQLADEDANLSEYPNAFNGERAFLTNLSGGEDGTARMYLVVKSADGSEFQFNGLNVLNFYNDFPANEAQIDIIGYRDGASTGSVTVQIAVAPTYISQLTSSQLTPGIFQNVDRVVITPNASSQHTPTDLYPGLWFSFNSFSISNPVYPSLSGTSSSVTSTTATISTTSDKASTIFYVVTTSSTEPTIIQVMAGKDHTGASAFKSGSGSATANVAKDFNVTGLAAVTQYYVYFVAIDGSNSPSSVSSAPLSTLASFTLNYAAGANGTLTGLASQTVDSSSSGAAVTAVPDAGYHFVKWSDENTNATRTDTNVISNVNVTASFAINSYTLNYAAGANGTLTGTDSQTVNSGASGTSVTAVPDAGYHFVKWSDDLMTATRTDSNVTANVSVTATFAIIPDTVSPVTRYHFDPIYDKTNSGKQYIKGYTTTLRATDNENGSGIKITQYRINGGAWITYTAPFTFYAGITHTVEYFSTDFAGNVENPMNLMDFDKGKFTGAGKF